MYKPLFIGLGAALLLFLILFSSILSVLLSPDQVAMAKLLAAVFRHSKQYKAHTAPTKPPGYVIRKQKGPMEVLVDIGPEWSVPSDFERDIIGGELTASEPIDEDVFLYELLDAHNAYRSRHDVPPLNLSQKISKYAKEWAVFLARSNKNMQYRSNSPYGENLFVLRGKKYPTVRGVMDFWYKEIEHYVFGKETITASNSVSNFAQIVWKNTKLLGCGMNTNTEASLTVIVCDYFPPGKVLGSYLRNVKRPKLHLHYEDDEDDYTGDYTEAIRD